MSRRECAVVGMLLAFGRGPAAAMQSEFEPARLNGGGLEGQGSGVVRAVTPLEEAGGGEGWVLRGREEPAESSEPAKSGCSRVEGRVYGGGRLLRGGDVDEAVANASRSTVSSLYEFEEPPNAVGGRWKRVASGSTLRGASICAGTSG